MGRYDIDGVFIGHDGELEVNAKLRLQPAAIEVTKSDGRGVAVTIPSEHPAVIRHMDKIASELHRIAYRHRSIRPIPKPSRTRKRSGEPVPCPDCQGVEPEVFDCDLCQGGGVIPG